MSHTCLRIKILNFNEIIMYRLRKHNRPSSRKYLNYHWSASEVFAYKYAVNDKVIVNINIYYV